MRHFFGSVAAIGELITALLLRQVDCLPTLSHTKKTGSIGAKYSSVRFGPMNSFGFPFVYDGYLVFLKN